MNEHTIKAVEGQLRLRNERLALREKEFGLWAKKWRVIAIVVLLLICGTVVFFGGMGLCKLSKDILSMKNCDNDNPSQESKKDDTQKTTTYMVPSNSLAVVTPPAKGDAVILKPESKMVSDKWLLVVYVIVNGMLVLAGLGVAAITVKNIANYNNELE